MRAEKEILLRKMQDGLESPASQSGKLEGHGANGHLPRVRERVHGDQGIRPPAEILQPCLREPRAGSGKERT